MARITITYPEKTLFTYSLPVRITDINYGQHLAHDKLMSMLHEARAQFFLHFNMEMALDDANRYGCDMVYSVSKDADNTLVATAKTGLVFFDYSKKKVSSIPSEFKKLLEK